MSITLMKPALMDAIFTGIRAKALICARPTRVLRATERRLTSIIRSSWSRPDEGLIIRLAAVLKAEGLGATEIAKRRAGFCLSRTGVVRAARLLPKLKG